MLEILLTFMCIVISCFIIILFGAIDDMWFGGYFASKVQNFIRRK